MIVEIVSTGTELLLGQIINSNTAYLAKRLNELGYDVLFQSTVGDNRIRMTQVFNTALERADIIVTTGGLGPTQGDITKEVTAGILGRGLYLHQPSQKQINDFFACRRIKMTENNLRQAMIPDGALVLPNKCGTAPGIVLETAKNTIIHLPGPPYEMEAMFEASVVPYLEKRFGSQGVIYSKVLRTIGLGESSLEEEIIDLIKRQGNPTIALLARSGEIHIRLTGKASSVQEAMNLIDGVEQVIRQRIGQYIFGVDDEALELVVGRMLKGKRLTVSFAESCTGGLVSSRITDIPGSSEYLVGSVVAYSNAIKSAIVCVDDAILRTYGAVSREVAEAMATGARSRFKSDIGIGITGIAGPGGASTDKPVGLVYIALAGDAGIECYEHRFTGQRSVIKSRSANAALNHLRQYILQL
ncbi:MAG: cinA [Firmicutes bacterium]|nr:cinA [Bacillota bacterium]